MSFVEKHTRFFRLQLRYSDSRLNRNVRNLLLDRRTSVRANKGYFLKNVSSSPGVGRDDKDLIVRVDLGGRISHEGDSIDIAGKSGRQTLQLCIDHAAN